MSLSITLTDPERTVERRGTGVFVRDGGRNRELSAAEVRERWPDSDITTKTWTTDEVFTANITHNLNTMATEAGVYDAMWRPDERDYTRARDVIGPLAHGLLQLLADPDRFRPLNPSNGWGDYDLLVDTVRAYLHAAIDHPNATIHVSR